MPRKVAVFMLACALVSTSALAGSANNHNHLRVASTSLCGDGYLLALAPENITALSWQSRHVLSRANEEKRSLPQLWDNIETLAAAEADIIVFGPGEGSAAKSYIQHAGLESHNLIWGETFESVQANIIAIGQVMGKVKEAETYSKSLSNRLKKLKQRADARGHAPSMLYLSRSGGTAGRGTYIDAAITAAGGKNIVKTPGWQTLDPEQVMTLSPDIIVTSFLSGGYESVQAKAIRHAVLVDFIESRPVIDIPGSLWPCAGPNLIDAAERIADGLDNQQ